MQVLVIQPDNECALLHSPEGMDELTFVQTLVGGYIEPAPCDHDGVTIWVNEDGIALGMPINPVASNMAGVHLFGPAVLTAADANEGWASINPTLLRMLREYINML